MSGGGFGALDSMNKSLKNNRALVRKISVFDRIKGYTSAQKNLKLTFNAKLTKEELEELRSKTIRKDRIHSIIQIGKMILVLGALFLLIFLIINGGMSK